MPYIQRNIPRPPKRLDYILNNFTGGLNNKSANTEIDANQASDLLNITFTEEGSFEKRHGIEATLTQHDEEIIFMDWFKPINEPKQKVIATTIGLYINDVKIHDLNGVISGTTFVGRYYFVDGDKYYVYGKFPQTTSTYETVKGTAVDSFVLLQITNPPKDETPLDDTHTTGMWTYDYDLKLAWYNPCDLELKDSHKGANVIPTKPTLMTVHGDRIFISGSSDEPHNVYITDIINPFYVPVGLPIGLPPNGDHITALKVFTDSIVVSRQNDMYVIYGNTNLAGLPDLFLMKKINTHTGVINNNACCFAHNFMFFLGGDGIVYKMHTTQTNVEIMATQVLSKTVLLDKPPISLTDYSRACMAFENDIMYLSIGQKMIVYHYKFYAWSIWENIKATYMFKFEDFVFGRYDGKIVKINDGYDDLGLPIPAYYATKLYDMDLPSNYKNFRDSFLVVKAYEDFHSDIKVSLELDYSEIKNALEIRSKISKWGIAKWGDRFINKNISPSLRIPIGRRGRVIRFIIANSEDVKESVNDKTDLDSISSKAKDDLFYVINEDKFYRFVYNNYIEVNKEDLFQPMKLYEIIGEYEIKGRR